MRKLSKSFFLRKKFWSGLENHGLKKFKWINLDAFILNIGVLAHVHCTLYMFQWDHDQWPWLMAIVTITDQNWKLSINFMKFCGDEHCWPKQLSCHPYYILKALPTLKSGGFWSLIYQNEHKNKTFAKSSVALSSQVNCFVSRPFPISSLVLAGICVYLCVFGLEKSN